MSRASRCAAALLLAIAALPGQTVGQAVDQAPAAAGQAARSPASFAWSDAPIVLDMDGVADSLERFRDLPGIRFLVSEEIKAFFEAILETAHADEAATIRKVGRTLVETRGRVCAAWRMDPAPCLVLAWQATEAPAPQRALAATVAEFIEAAQAEDGAKREVRVGDAVFDVRALESIEATLPQLIDGIHVCWFGEDLEANIAASLAKRHEQALFVVEERPPFALRFDAPRLRALVGREFDARFGDGAWARFEGPLGLTAVQTCEMALRTAGQHLAQDFTLKLAEGAERGVFSGAMLPLDTAPPSVIGRLAPDDVAELAVLRLDWTAIWDGAKQIVPLLADQQQDVAAWEEKLSEYLRVDLRRDLLPVLGQDCAFVSPAVPAHDIDELAVKREAANGYFFAFSLANEEKFAKTLDKLLRARALHVSRRSTQHAGAKLFSLPLFGWTTVHYAVARGHFVLGIGALGRERVVHALDKLLAAETTALPTTPFSPRTMEEVSSQVAQFRGTIYGYSISRFSSLLEGIESTLTAVFSELVLEGVEMKKSELEDVDRIVVAMRDVVKKAQDLGMNTSLAGITVRDGKILFRQVW